MQKRPWEISDLLAYRDGEPHTADLSSDAPEVVEMLARIREIRAGLNNLPDEPVDESLWLDLLPPAQPVAPAWLRYPLATAASVFFASVIGMYVLFGGIAQNTDLNSQATYAVIEQADSLGQELAVLMGRSQALERRLQVVDPIRYATNTTAQRVESLSLSGTERRLMGRLADIDRQIAQLYERQPVDDSQRKVLWSQRVDLLESIVALRAGRDPQGIADNTDSQTRSM